MNRDQLLQAGTHSRNRPGSDDSLNSEPLESERSLTVGKVMESLSHHINNILQGIHGGTYLIDDGLKKHNYELVQNGWQMVQRNQDLMSNLVMDMLAFSTQRAPLLGPVDLNELLRNTINRLQRCAAYIGVDVELDSEMKLDPIALDSEMIGQAFYNVLTTSIFSCRDNSGGKIEIKLRKTDNHAVQIRIQDNGMGLTEEELKTVFDPLLIDEYSNRTGIRMAVSRKILLEHGGEILVKRGPVEHSGTVFILNLPIVQFVGACDDEPSGK